MSHGEPRVSSITDPGPLKESVKWYAVGTTMVTIGICALGFQFLADIRLACAAYLEGFFFALCLGLAGAFFVAVNYVAGSVWHIPMRRIMEAMTAYLPWAFWTLFPLLGMYYFLYDWSHPGHLKPEGTKAQYFNPWFWAFRCVFYVLIWNYFTSHYRKVSVAQDQHKQPMKMTLRSSVFLIIFAFTFTLFSIDTLMSLRVHWFSTMWGVYCFAGMMQAGFCTMILFAIYFRNKGYFNETFKDRHLFDLGTWLLAWCTFMVYIGFSQFMLIWYANLPEETVFFIDHTKAGWKYVYAIVFFVKWAIPFLVLMPKPARKNHKVLTVMCVLIILAEWLDIYWMVSPEIIGPNALSLHTVYSFLVSVGFLGIFILAVAGFLSKNSVVAVGEPKLLSSVNGDYL